MSKYLYDDRNYIYFGKNYVHIQTIDYQTQEEAAMYYGPVMIDLEGTSLSKEEEKLCQHPAVGGIILFKRNYSNPEAVKEFITEIRAIAKKPLLIAVDHEGGIVWRFTEGFMKLPPAISFGDLYDKDKTDGLKHARTAGMIMASELLKVGVDISLAPVLDLDKGISQVVLNRAFHADPLCVTELAGAFIKGMNLAGMQATGKHFPGHGSCKSDSHLEQVTDNRSLAEMMKDDIIPFKNLASVLHGIMPAHVLYPQIDNVPAGFSKKWLQDILRHELGFKGAIISDCLSMKGAAVGGDYVIRARMALDAGCDMVILCNQSREQLTWVLDKLDRRTNDLTQERLHGLAGDFTKQHLGIADAVEPLKA